MRNQVTVPRQSGPLHRLGGGVRPDASAGGPSWSAGLVASAAPAVSSGIVLLASKPDRWQWVRPAVVHGLRRKTRRPRWEYL